MLSIIVDTTVPAGAWFSGVVEPFYYRRRCFQLQYETSILWVRSLAGSIGLLCVFYALTHLPISTTLTLSNTSPLWVTLLAWPTLGHRPAAADWIAIAIGIVGVVLIQRPDLSDGRLAGLLALVSAVCTAIAMVGLNKLHTVDTRIRRVRTQIPNS